MSEDRNTQGPKLLHLGCGLTAPQGWTNVDGSLNAWLAQRPRLKAFGVALRVVPRDKAAVPWPTNILIADLRKRLPFPDGSFDAVYSSHTIEHLHRDGALKLLREAWRVLRPGGRCRTLVPDLKKIVDDYVAGRAAAYSAHGPPHSPMDSVASDDARRQTAPGPDGNPNPPVV